MVEERETELLKKGKLQQAWWGGGVRYGWNSLSRSLGSSGKWLASVPVKTSLATSDRNPMQTNLNKKERIFGPHMLKMAMVRLLQDFLCTHPQGPRKVPVT